QARGCEPARGPSGAAGHVPPRVERGWHAAAARQDPVRHAPQGVPGGSAAAVPLDVRRDLPEGRSPGGGTDANIGGLARVLEVAALHNAQITNTSNIARDAQVARQTVQGYFDVLVDTLLGSWLHAWKLKRATKLVAHPKFYFFDAGVARALSTRLPYPPTQ